MGETQIIWHWQSCFFSIAKIFKRSKSNVQRPESFGTCQEKDAATGKTSSDFSISYHQNRRGIHFHDARLRPSILRRSAHTYKKRPKHQHLLGLKGALLVIPLGLEPKTVCLEGRCSIRLSYGTGSKTVQRCKIEMHYLS